MCLAIKQRYEETGQKIGFKPAGGISTPDEALVYLTIVQEIWAAIGLPRNCSGLGQAGWLTMYCRKFFSATSNIFNREVFS
jgi:deoxyribose-phosphate aldolase